MHCFRDESYLDGLHACVALGMFDGVHRGHAALLKACVEKAEQNNVPSVVYTYSNSPHPKKQSEVQGFLTTEEEKLFLCEKIGIHFAVSKAFTPEYKHMSPESFVDLLVRNGRVSALFCGMDYRFGYKGSGDAALLQKLGQEAGIEVICVEDVLQRGSPISSSRIRAALLKGDCESASDLLGRPYSVFACFENARSAWPMDKARIALGEYICSFDGNSLRVSVSEDGTIHTSTAMTENRKGELQFLQQSGHHYNSR